MFNLSTSLDSSSLIEHLASSIMSFEKNFPLEDFQKSNYKQNPFMTLLTCSDARMPVTVFGDIFNRIFSVENIGNQVKTAEGSVLYGLLHLHTPIMVIAGHTDCGAIKAADSNFVDEIMGIRNELSTVKNSLEDILYKTGFKTSADPGIKFSQLAELNVDIQVDYLLANRLIADLVDKNELLIIGVMADLHNIYGNGHGRLYTVNINGEHNTDILKSYSYLGLFADQAQRLVRK